MTDNGTAHWIIKERAHSIVRTRKYQVKKFFGGNVITVQHSRSRHLSDLQTVLYQENRAEGKAKRPVVVVCVVFFCALRGESNRNFVAASPHRPPALQPGHRPAGSTRCTARPTPCVERSPAVPDPRPHASPPSGTFSNRGPVDPPPCPLTKLLPMCPPPHPPTFPSPECRLVRRGTMRWRGFCDFFASRVLCLEFFLMVWGADCPPPHQPLWQQFHRQYSYPWSLRDICVEG